MADIKAVQASGKDLKQLLVFFKHYKVRTIIQNRVNCYLSHNCTVVAKDKNRIVGILQWYVKENPNTGVAEFEEVYVLDGYRSKGIGLLLIKYTIRLVKDYFTDLKIQPRKIFLFVNKRNKAARRLYQKCGFNFVAKVGNLFSDTETELFYCLNLR